MTDGRVRAWAAVGAVALGTFTLVTNEFLPVGMLTKMAEDFGVTEGVAGTMMTVPGIVAAIAAPTLTVAAGRIDRRIFLIGMSALFTIADLLGSIATEFPIMLVARFLLGLGIGGFWAIGATIGARLIGGASATRATAVIFSGVSIASVVGVPAGSFIGATWGWRAAFVATAVLGIIALVGQLVLLPKLGVESAVTWRELGSVLRGHNARIGLLATTLLVGGQFVAYTYVGPFLLQETRVQASTVSALLFVYGAAGIAGNFGIAGLLKRNLFGSVVLVGVLVSLSAATLPLLGLAPISAGFVLAVWGLAYGAVPVAMQTWVFNADLVSPEGGSALYISAFQISVAGGSFFGGVVVDRSSTSVAMFTGAVLAALAVIALALFRTRQRDEAAPPLRSRTANND